MRTLYDHEASEATRALRLACLLADPVELIFHLEAALASCTASTKAEHHSTSGNHPSRVIPPVTGSACAQMVTRPLLRLGARGAPGCY
jgi:hypothetical protein